ncbi:MAG TPA: c-type cytochrome [Phycisphaerae bacterium]|nr:c-type cytochrome [Phycisphaerae bacterium]
MRRISRRWYVTGMVFSAGLAAAAAIWCTSSSNADDNTPPSGQQSSQPVNPLILRGYYLTNQVAMCGTCHSPRDSDGKYILSEWLQGADINFAPTPPPPHWPQHAPGIAGLPSFRGNRWSADDMTHFLVTGLNPRGHYAGEPMPAYRFDEDDAKAVTAYLQSLPSGDQPPPN